jgi:synaptobrevin family protein YKT6
MRADGLCGSITCDAEYPPRVAFSLLTRLLEDFSLFKPDWARETRNEAAQWPQLESDVLKYQDPANADQIMKIQRSLDETRDVLHNTIGGYFEMPLCYHLPSFSPSATVQT